MTAPDRVISAYPAIGWTMINHSRVIPVKTGIQKDGMGALISLSFELPRADTGIRPYIHFPLPNTLCAMLYALCTLLYALCAMRFALFTMRYALCSMRFALCAMPFALCAMPFALCALHFFHFLYIFNVLIKNPKMS